MLKVGDKVKLRKDIGYPELESVGIPNYIAAKIFALKGVATIAYLNCLFLVTFYNGVEWAIPPDFFEPLNTSSNINFKHWKKVNVK